MIQECEKQLTEVEGRLVVVQKLDIGHWKTGE